MNLHSILNKGRHRVARPVAMLVAVGVAMLGGIAFTATSATAVSEGPDPQVWVCKYVGTPFVNETLQTGNGDGGLIRVNANATSGAVEGQYYGTEFSDNQGRSFVLDVATDANTTTGDGEGQQYIGTAGPCPAGQGPVRATAVFTAGNCDVPGSVVLSESRFYDWVITGDLGARYYTADPKPGVTLTGQTEFGPYDLRAGEPCSRDVQLPTLTATRVCNAVGSVNVVANSNFTWAVTGPDTARIYTATASAGVVLKGDTEQGPFDVSPIPFQSTNPDGDCYVAPLPGEVEGTVVTAPIKAPVKAPVEAPVVLGVVVNAPPAAVAGPGTLAFTGAETVPLGSAGLIMLALGIALTAAGRRRSGQRVRG